MANFNKTIAKYYDKVVNKGYHNENQYLEELLRILPEKSKVLEIGCGTGQILIPLLKNKINCEGIDESKEMVLVLKSKLPSAKVKVSKINKINEDYDYIVSCNGPIVIKGNEVESYILDEQELKKTISLLLTHSKNGILINKGIEKPKLKINFSNNLFIHQEFREKNIMTMINLLFKNQEYLGTITLTKKRYPMSILDNYSMKQLNNFILIKHGDK